MRELVIHLLILFGIPTGYFMVGTIGNSLRAWLMEKARAKGASKNNPWVFLVIEYLLYRDLNRKGVVTWLIDHLIKPLQPYVETDTYFYVFMGLMAFTLLIYFLNRRKHIVGNFLLSFVRIPLDLIYLVTFGAMNYADKYPPELGYSHSLPENHAQKTVTVMKPSGS